MKKSLCLIILFLAFITCNAQIIIGYPKSESISLNGLKISKIELWQDQTLISFTVYADDGWFCADKNYFIRKSNSNEKLKLIEAKGVPICPENHKFKKDTLSFVLKFPPLSKGTDYIDIIEDCTQACVTIKKVLVNPVISEIESSYMYAYEQYRANNYKESLEKALALKLTIKDTNYFRYGQCKLLIADNYLWLKEYDKAKPLYEEIMNSNLIDSTDVDNFYDPFANYKYKACKGLGYVYEYKSDWANSLKHVNMLLKTYPFYTSSGTHWREEANYKLEWQIFLYEKLQQYDDAAFVSLDYILNGIYDLPRYISASSGPKRFLDPANQWLVNLINEHYDYEQILKDIDVSLNNMVVMEDEKYYHGQFTLLNNKYKIDFRKSWLEKDERCDKNFLINLIKKNSFYDKLKKFDAANLKNENDVFVYKGLPYTGEFYEYYNNGSVKTEGHMKNGLFCDTIKQYYENGTLKIFEVYGLGLQNGLGKKYYENGAIESEEYFIAGKRNGKCIYWYPSGKQIEKVEFSSGDLAGLSLDAVSDDKIKRQKKAEIVYKNDIIQGIVKVWFENGQLFRQGEYIDGNRNGKWKEWNESGEVVKQAVYNNGVLKSGDEFSNE